MAAIKDLVLDVATFVWAVMIMGMEVPRPQQKPKPIRREVTWQESLIEIQTL